MLERAAVEAPYLAPLAPLFHGLRPLRLVVDTTCRPAARYLRQLASQSACEVLYPLDKHDAPMGPAAAGGSLPADRRAAALGRQIVAALAHLGAWIDGCGESIRLFDERGNAVDGERLCRLLAACVCREKPGATIVLPGAASEALQAALAQRDARVIAGASTREETLAAIEAAGADFAGDARGAFWFSGSGAAPDAVLAASTLLVLFSQTDRPVSEVLDAV
jgi:phosphomannomutase